MEQGELLQYLVVALDEIGIPYMIGGSHASIYYGEPRHTLDIDVVADVRPEHIPALVEKFPFPDFYLSVAAIREAVDHRGQFNIIHPSSGLKIDIILPKQTPYDVVQFQRRQRLPLVPGREASFARPEDVILYKLIYYREGGSEKHLRDVAGIVRISGDDLDRDYIARWAGELGLRDIWDAILRRLEKEP